MIKCCASDVCMYIYTCVSIFVCLHLCIYACVCVCVCVADHTQIRLAVSFVLVRRPANHGLLFEGIILPESKGAGEGDGRLLLDDGVQH